MANYFRFNTGTTPNDTLESTGLHDLNVSIKFTRGNYPNKLTIASDIGVRLNESNTFSETISNLFVSYDHYVRYWLEGFVFLDRFSNNFLSIDQRYEVGAGLVFDIHPLDYINGTNESFKTVKKGVERLKNIDKKLDPKAKWIKYYLSQLNRIKRDTTQSYSESKKEELEKLLIEIDKER